MYTKLKRSLLYDCALITFAIVCGYTIQFVYESRFEITAQNNNELIEEVSLKSALIETQQVDDILAAMQQYVPNDSQRSNLTSTISQWARSFGLELVNIDFATISLDPASEEESMDRSSLFERALRSEVVQMQVRGDEESVTQFITQLESSPRLIDIVSLSIEPNVLSGRTIGSIEAYVYHQ